MKHPFSKTILLLLLIVVSAQTACTSVATQEPQTQVEARTPTPEVFNPLNPSPTPSDSALPLTCQITDLNVYVNEEWGYCFAYPFDFEADDSKAADGIVSFYGPALEDSADPVRVSLEVTTQPVPEGSTLTSLVDAYLTSFQNVTMPVPITREPWRLGNEPVEKLEPIPGLLSSRVVMTLHNNILFTLRFHPSDIDFAEADLDALTQTVTGSFAFLPQFTSPALRWQTVSWYEFGQNISLSYDAKLAPWVDAQTVPAVPIDDQTLFAGSHPTYAQIRFLGFQGGRSYDLPIAQENRVAQIMIFQTADFPGFGDTSPQGFVNQQQALTDLLRTGVDPNHCAKPLQGYDEALPFLPWINMKQVFCAQPKVIEFPGGKGIRYLSHYSQAPDPVLDQQVFYTFQGLTDDGQFYVSALFPVQTGIFPKKPTPCSKCSDPNYNPFPEWTALIETQLTDLNAQAEDKFTPSLAVLDEVIRSIQIGQ